MTGLQILRTVFSQFLVLVRSVCLWANCLVLHTLAILKVLWAILILTGIICNYREHFLGDADS